MNATEEIHRRSKAVLRHRLLDEVSDEVISIIIDETLSVIDEYLHDMPAEEEPGD